MEPASSTPRKSPQTAFRRRFLLALCLSVCGFLAAAAAHYLQQSRKHRSVVYEGLVARAELKARAVRTLHADALRLAEQRCKGPVASEDVPAYLARRDEAARGRILVWMRSFIDYGNAWGFRRMCLVNTAGRSLETYGGGMHRELADVPGGLAALRAGSFSYLDVSREERTDEVESLVLQPILDGRRRVVGGVVFHLDPRVRLFPELTADPSSGGVESLLVRREGDEVLFLTSPRGRNAPPCSLRRPIGDGSDPAARAARGEAAACRGRDEAGRRVYAVTRPVAGTPWGLLVQTGADEVDGPFRIGALIAALLGGTLLSLIAFLGLDVWRRREKLLQTERAAKAALYETLLRQAGDVILLLDEEGKILETNDRAAALYGRSREELLRLNIKELRAPETLKDFQRQLQRVLTDEGLRFETVHVAKDGTRIPVEVTARAVGAEGWRCIQSIVRDLRERRVAERALAENEQKFVVLAAATQDAIVMIDNAGAVTFWNAAAERMLGWSAKEIAGRNLHEVIAPERLRQAHRDAFPRWQKTGQGGAVGRILELPALCKDGRELRIELSLSSVESGGEWHAVAILRDVTGRRRYEEALKESEEKYRALVETTRTGFLILDAEGRVVDANAEYVRLSGHASLSEIRGRSVVEWTAASAREKNAAAVRQCVRDGHIFGLELDYVHGDGTVVPVEINATVEESGESMRIISLCRDISPRHRIEEESKENERKFRRLVENLHGDYFFYRHDAQGVFEYLSPSVEQVLGYGMEDFKRHYTTYLSDDPVNKLCVAHTDGSLRGVQQPPYEVDILHKNGSRHRMQVLEFPVFGPDGKVTAVEGLAHDITAMRRAEERLQERQDFLRTMLESIPNPVFFKDAKGLYQDCNASFAQFLGVPRERILGKTVFEVSPEENARVYHEKDLELMRRGGVQVYEARVHTADKGERVVVFYKAPTHHRDGKVSGLVGVILDITERKGLEQKTLLLEKMESLGVLAGGIAHDFNNLLTAMLGNLSLVESAAADPKELREIVGDAIAASREAQRLTQQLLTFARGGRPVKKVLSPTGLLHEAIRLALRTPRPRCEAELPEDLWNIEADEGQLLQAFHNLLLNAAQASPEGGVVRVTAENVELPKGAPPPLGHGRFVRVSVSDEGRGIPPENLKRVFEPYFTTKERGKGLGLATCFSIIQSHGGLLEARSAPGEGASFTVTLPATAEALASAALPGQAARHRGSGRILVMDDEEAVARVLGRMLEVLGYETDAVADGSAMLACYRAARAAGRPFKAVILDLVVPAGMGGKEAVLLLKAEHPDALTIVSSGYSDDPVMAEFRRHGFSAVLSKPYQLDELSAVLEGLLPSS
ncbi:MAG: PAS domain S-box protein [Elusimicrobiota bacterium]